MYGLPIVYTFGEFWMHTEVKGSEITKNTKNTEHTRFIVAYGRHWIKEDELTRGTRYYRRTWTFWHQQTAWPTRLPKSNVGDASIFLGYQDPQSRCEKSWEGSSISNRVALHSWISFCFGVYLVYAQIVPKLKCHKFSNFVNYSLAKGGIIGTMYLDGITDYSA